MVNFFLINLLLIHQLVIMSFLGERVNPGFLLGYAKGFIIVTFSLIWKKPKFFGKNLLFHNNFQLATINFLSTYR